MANDITNRRNSQLRQDSVGATSVALDRDAFASATGLKGGGRPVPPRGASTPEQPAAVLAQPQSHGTPGQPTALPPAPIAPKEP